MLLSLTATPSAVAQIGLIDSEINGPANVCQDDPITYITGPGACNGQGFYWEITYQGALVFGEYKNSSCGYGYARAPLPDFVNIGGFVDAGCGLAFYSISNSLPIKFKRAGTYKLKASSIARKVYPYVGFCKDVEKTITVLAPNTTLTVANSISGARFIECTFGGTAGNNITYAVPAVNGATSYRWTINTTSGSGLNGSFGGSSTLVTTEPNATATYRSVSGYTQGTLRVDAFGPCGATTTGSRTFDLARIEPSSSVTQSGSVGCSRCFTAPNGTNYNWTLPGNQPDVYIESANGQTACIRSRVSSGVSGYLQVAYNGGCAGARLSTGTSYYISPCSGRVSFEELVTESVSPNPANDVLTVTHPSESYEVTLTDMLGKAVLRQASTGHECLMKVARVPGGLYILQIRVGDFVHSQHRIIVAH